MASIPSRDELRDHLVASQIAGSVQTQVWDVLRKAEHLAEPEFNFGLSGLERYSPADVLDQIRVQYGWTHTPGEPGTARTWIDPDLVLAELDRAADRLARAAREGQRVLLATGHPTGIMALHQQLGLALRAAGAKLLRPADGHRLVLDGRPRMIRYVLDVATLSSGANLYHTHSPAPMQAVLDRTEPDEIDLVIGDHGWAGAAADRGIDVVAIADINDTALPMAKHDGRVGVVLGMDDNVLPRHYDPLADHLIAGLG